MAGGPDHTICAVWWWPRRQQADACVHGVLPCCQLLLHVCRSAASSFCLRIATKGCWWSEQAARFPSYELAQQHVSDAFIVCCKYLEGLSVVKRIVSTGQSCGWKPARGPAVPRSFIFCPAAVGHLSFEVWTNAFDGVGGGQGGVF